MPDPLLLAAGEDFSTREQRERQARAHILIPRAEIKRAARRLKRKLASHNGGYSEPHLPERLPSEVGQEEVS